MKASEIMTKDPFTVQEGSNFNFVEVSAELKHVRHIPVLNDAGQLTGIVSIRDLLAHLSIAGASHFIPIKELATPNPFTVQVGDDASKAAKLMVDNFVGCIPVLDGDKLVGIISERDFVKQHVG